MNEDERMKFKAIIGLVAGGFALAAGDMAEEAVDRGKQFADAADKAGMIDELISVFGEPLHE